jgi:hypothetical protein
LKGQIPEILGRNAAIRHNVRANFGFYGISTTDQRMERDLSENFFDEQFHFQTMGTVEL